MNILCLETSAALCSVAVLKDGDKFYCENQKPMAHAEVLMQLIKECTHLAGIEMKDFDAVALSGGPGSYTGLRIGCSSAKGICYALGIPLIVINTLKIAAYAARQKFENYQYYWPMTDARRMEVYHTIFNKDLDEMMPVKSAIITNSDFIPGILGDGSVILCGDGATKAFSHLGIKDAEVVANALSMCELAREAFESSEFVDVAYYEPFYLKQANITVSKS